MQSGVSHAQLLEALSRIVPELNHDSHKGQSGKVGVMGGCREYTGAPFFAAMSAMRMGVDLSYVFCSPSAAPVIKGYSPELIVLPMLPETPLGGEGQVAQPPEYRQKCLGFIERLSVLIIGPGLGDDPQMERSLEDTIRFAREHNLPLIIDGSGLNFIANRLQLVQGYANCILTPNIAEFGRLAKAAGVQLEGPMSTQWQKHAQELAGALGGPLLVSKGRVDVLTDGTRSLVVTADGSPRRCGGQGDILTGTMATFIAWQKAAAKQQQQQLLDSAALSAPAVSPLMLAAYGGCITMRAAALHMYGVRGRSMVAGDMLEALGDGVLRRCAARAASGQAPRVFEFSRFASRNVVLQLMYVGWSYHGFARQACSENTIEGILFLALRHVKLIPEDAEVASLGYSRCGRTDKGVLCLKLRSAASAGQPLPQPEQELDYPGLINKALPDDIRVLGWTDMPGPDFSARFSCGSRQYKYFIVQDGSLDVGAMQQAAQALLGEHDFRNFCKADVIQVQNFMRRVLSVSLEPAGTCCPGMTVLALHITGTAFLWHQVRCIAAVLLMVGRGQEPPDIVQRLLDVQQEPCKPQYNMASEEPLLLYSCSFKDLTQPWNCSTAGLVRNLTAVSSQLQQHLVGAAITSAIYEQLQQQWQQQQGKQGRDGGSTQPPAAQHQQHTQAASSNGGSSSSSSSSSSRWVTLMPQQMPLLKREREPSMEERFAKAGISLELLNQPGGSARLLQKKPVDTTV